ncbi:MAG TPA: glutathione S-transferase family protein [Caldimonas sp.]
MKLYSSPISSNARKVRLAASMLGIPLELVNIDLGKGAQRTPEFLAINPMGRVPVLEDGDFVLTESAAIMAYLADAKPDSPLYPRDLKQRANVNRWLFWGASHWGPAFAALAFEKWIKKFMQLGEPDLVQVKRQEDALRGLATVLDAHLASREWVCGPTITIADLAIAASLGAAERVQFRVADFVAMEVWFEKVKALEAWKSTEPPSLPTTATR